MSVCARPGCDDTVIPALDPDYCSRMCRMTHLHPELASMRDGSAAWAQWMGLQMLPCLNSTCVCGDAA